jgi:thiol-disulfide isomerase/thioredoxin
MKRLFMAVIALALVTQQAVAQKTVTIKGTVKGDTKGYNKIFVYGFGITNDSVSIADGKFEFKIPFNRPVVPAFYTEYERETTGGIRPYPIIIQEPGILELKDIDIEKGLYTGTISGIKSAEAFQAFNKQKGGTEEVKQFILHHPESFVSIYLLLLHKGTMADAELAAVYKNLNKEIRQTEEGKIVADYIRGLSASAIGKTIKDFTLNNEHDKPFSFSKLTGKYVILDFWASWCGPCKESFPHMKEIYQNYKGKNFEIYSISADESKSAWLKQLNKENLPWLQAHDSKNIARSQFAVSAFPTTFLIDPTGKVLLKELGFQSDGSSKIEQKLKEIFTDNKTR